MNHLITPVAPDAEPVTVTELAWNLRLTTDKESEYTGADADYLAMLISAARADAENYTHRYWAVQTLERRFRDFDKELKLTANLREIEEVVYLDAESEQENVLGPEHYLPVFNYAECGIEFRNSFQFPAVAERSDAVRIRFEVGPQSVANELHVPATVKQAIIMIASHWYENRESANITGGGMEIRSVAQTYEWLLGSHVIYGIG